ncbi:phage late control D family protein [Variovorax sp. RA8]|uniref:phage late control D family protein n=1 Tax=Variovorax sp. (strain JCM 16519 / RA8) TaxID=662548 RepID=UPI001315E642|nr:phage late control D family protein [Variovorax sp. RA8]VTU28814.1 Phage protein D [Variovorax sp. RA8]
MRLAPEFALGIDGNAIPAALRASIVSISYTDGIEGADRVEVSIANPSLQWLDHPLLQVNNAFRLSIGYAPGPLEEVFVGEITGVEPSFPASGIPMIRLTAQDLLQRLQIGTKDRSFRIKIPSVGNFPLPDSAVAALVSGTNGLIPELDPVGGTLSTLIGLATFLAFPQFAQMSVRKQSGVNDFQFLTEVAKDNGWQMYIDHTAEPRGRVLKFQFLIQDYAPSLTLKWGASLMDFTPRLSTVGEIEGVAARVWVDSIKMDFVIALNWDYDRAMFKLSITPGGELGELLAPGKVTTIKPASYATAPRKILSELLPKLNNRLTGSGSTAGDPRIKASRVVNLEGLGAQFGGLYRITSATHTIDGGGYKTSFQARKEVWFGSIPAPRGAGGLVRLQGQFSV